MLNKSKILLLVIIMTGLLIAGCSSNDSKTDAIQITNETTAGEQSTSTTGNSIPAFAQYLTVHAPIADNWQEMTAADLLKSYDEKISKIELISDDMYQVYITINGADAAYVAVNARTGYFHG